MVIVSLSDIPGRHYSSFVGSTYFLNNLEKKHTRILDTIELIELDGVLKLVGYGNHISEQLVMSHPRVNAISGSELVSEPFK